MTKYYFTTCCKYTVQDLQMINTYGWESYQLIEKKYEVKYEVKYTLKCLLLSIQNMDKDGSEFSL
jgi:hypothetical protein